MKRFFVILLVCCLFSPLVANAQRVYLDISAPEARKIRFAVPWLQNSGTATGQQAYGRNLSQTLAKALAFHGIIEVAETAAGSGTTHEEWQRLGVDYATLGRYTISGDKISLEIRLFDASSNDMLMGKSYSGPSSQTDEMLFKFTDAVINELTGKPGLATTQIAFVSQPPNKREKEIYITDILGKTLRQVTRHQSLVVSPRFSPDGTYLCYTSYHSGNQNLYITDLRQNKTTQALSRRPGMNLAPAWSPDGNTMAVTLSHEGNPDLYLINRRGEILKQLTRNAGINVSPDFSPDGRYLVFVSDRSKKPQLYLMELATGNTQRITYEGTENAEPSWSPTENLVVYSSRRDGIYQLCTVDPFRDRSEIQLTQDQTHHESPFWSPDGNQIIFAKRDGAGHKIYGIMKNGSYQRMLFSLPGSQSYPRWAVKTY